MLRLYLAWPHRFEAEPETEARLFHSWLKENYGDISVVSSINCDDDVAEFLSCNPEVIEAAKFLKPSQASTEGEVRTQRRISTSTYVFVGVYDCDAEPSLIGQSLKGNVIDVTPKGLGIEVTEAIPKGAILNMTVAPAGTPVVLYRITGEVRWVKLVDNRYQLGIKMFEMDEAERWQKDFDTRFQIAH